MAMRRVADRCSIVIRLIGAMFVRGGGTFQVSTRWPVQSSMCRLRSCPAARPLGDILPGGCTYIGWDTC